jgi:hypothetical protein
VLMTLQELSLLAIAVALILILLFGVDVTT